MTRVERDLVGNDISVPGAEAVPGEIAVGLRLALQGDQAVRQLALEQAGVEERIGLVEAVIGDGGGLPAPSTVAAVRETIAGAPASPTARAPLDRVCQAFPRISITLFASSSESTAAYARNCVPITEAEKPRRLIRPSASF